MPKLIKTKFDGMSLTGPFLIESDWQEWDWSCE